MQLLSPPQIDEEARTRIRLNQRATVCSLTLSYDGVQLIDQTGIDITDTNTPIGGLFLSTFYGGNDSSWAPSKTMQLSFTGFGLQ